MSFYWKFGTGIIALVIITLLLYQFSLIALNVVGGYLIYLVIVELLDFLERKGLTEAQSRLLLALGSGIMILVFILYISFPLFEQIQGFITQLPELTDRIVERLARVQDSLPFVGRLLTGLQQRVTTDIEGLLSLSGSIITSILTIPIIALILLSGRKTLKHTLLEMLPNDYFEVTITIANQIIRHVQDYVFARSMETLAMIIIYAIGFQLIGLPQGLFMAVLGGLLNLIPYIGPLLTIPPLIAVAFFGDGGALVIWSLVVLAIAQIIDNTLLQTWLVAKIVDVHPFIVVVVTLASGQLLGVLGMIVAIPLYVVTKLILIGMYDYLRAVQRHEELLAHTS